MDMVTKNVAALVRPPAAVRPLQRVWSRDDVALFLAATAQQPYGPLWRLLLTTGMRIGEALGLTWADVDLERGTVSIRRTITRDLRGKATLGETTKTPSSLRTIGIPPTVVAALRHQRDAQTFTRRHAGPLWQDHGLVFARWQGGIIAPNTVRAAFERDCKLAGVDPIRLHDLRHTAATLLVESGERLESIRDRLGHRSLATTADLYLSLSVEHDQAVGERLERFIKGLG
jgi:integrase